ncbi:hypothetical protein DFH09DRAFT_1158265 [Mycena vulgaris]|nr:hypothetical protein DFH09DRAFT_1158265 [Mycena vulgaris]
MADAQAAERASLASKIILLDYAHLVGMTILYWDHVITLDREINLLWKRRKSLSSYCFFVNRYFAFLSGIPVLLHPFLTLSSEMCIRYTFSREIILIVTQLIVSVILALRIYALYGRSRRVLLSLIGIGAAVLGVSLWSVNGQQGHHTMIVGGCHFILITSTSYRLAGCWEALFVFDSIVFGLTVYNAYTTRDRMIPRSNIHTLVLRDGAMYFGIMALANLANIATYYVDGILGQGALGTFANCISITMVSRLILNLHEHANVGIFSELTGPVVQHNYPLRSVDDIAMPQRTPGPPYGVYTTNTSPLDGRILPQTTPGSRIFGPGTT